MKIIENYFDRSKLILMAACFALLSILPVTKVSAVSDYDDAIHTTTQLKVGLSGYSDIDMTSQYMSYVLGDTTEGVEQNWCSSDCRNLISDSLDNGDWAISQIYSNYDQYMVFLNFCNGKMSSTDISDYDLGSTHWYWLYGSSSSPVDCVSINIVMNSSGHIVISSTILPNQTMNALVIAAHVKKTDNSVPYYIAPYIYTASNTINYPSGYEGAILTDNETDGDGDGLDVVQETKINTSDAKIDTDGDGLDDLTESPWKPNRDAIFCDTSTPKNCAYPNPTKKDIYVEVDWMQNGSELYKPSTTQLNSVVGMFASKNIAVHFDTGEYGGGNELPTYTQNLRTKPLTGYVSFKDYKDGGEGISANFASVRDNVWRYMIYGNKYIANSADGHLYDSSPSDSSGVSEVGGDDIFIAGKVIADTDGVESQDLAVASTIAHELGHNLCLTDVLEAGDTLPSECAYAGVDNDNESDDFYNLVNYKSIMNYRYQLTQDYLGSVDYSDGTHGTLFDPKDHDDWGAVMLGMSSFSSSARTGLGSRSSEPAKKTMDSRLTVAH